MRITNNMLINNMLNNIGNNLTRMDKYQNQMATGKRIQLPSDDPVIAARALKLRTDVSEVDQYQRNIKDAQSWLDITESTLNNIGDVLKRTRELAVQAANGTNTPEDTQKIASEIKQLRSQIIHLGNSTYAGRYIFSGYQTDVPLLDEATGRFLISVNNTEDIKYEIGIGDNININVPGGDLFNMGGVASGDTSGTAVGNALAFPLVLASDELSLSVDGGANTPVTIATGTYNNMKDLVTAIQTGIESSALKGKLAVTASGNSLKFISTTKGVASSVHIDTASPAANDLGLQGPPLPVETGGVDGQVGSLISDYDDFITALNNGDNNTVSNMLSVFDNHINNLLRVRADTGARVNRLDLTANRLDNDNINFTRLMSENEDVDMSETIMNLKNEENVYNASLAGGARIIQPSLVDFLR